MADFQSHYGFSTDQYCLEDEGVVAGVFSSNEFVDDAYNILRGDLFLKLSDVDNKFDHYHIEIQTLNDDCMVIRMLEYGISKAREIAKYEGDQEETVFYIPEQLVIFIEQNPSIKDELRLRLMFPDGQEVNYRVPVMKYWEYSKEKIIGTPSKLGYCLVG